jgi:integrase/recombinase XerD
MATVAIVLKTKQPLSNGEFTVALRVTQNRIRKYFNLSTLVTDQSLKFRCTLEHWRPAELEDNGLGLFLRTVKGYKQLNAILEEKLNLAQSILREYDQSDIPFDFDNFEQDLRGNRNGKRKGKLLLQDYYSLLIKELEEQHKVGLVTVYEDTKNMLYKFRPSAYLTDVNVKFLEAFEAWLRFERSNKDPTISVKIRNIQRVINLAIADKLFKADDYPFGEKKYSVNKRLNHKTRKRFVPIDIISKVKELDIENDEALRLSRDIFLFSYYTRGMNFIDIAGLKWTDIENNEIHYVRRKTGQLFEIPINEHALEIMNYYKEHNHKAGGYIFPIYDIEIHKTEKQRYTRKKTAIKKVNDKLKDVAKLIGHEGLKLTTYVSRHSYATNLKLAGVATSYISEALGHTTEEQTQTYLAGFEKGTISKLESKIFDF